eukprot:167092-Amphidinium_carterae.1
MARSQPRVVLHYWRPKKTNVDNTGFRHLRPSCQGEKFYPLVHHRTGMLGAAALDFAHLPLQDLAAKAVTSVHGHWQGQGASLSSAYFCNHARNASCLPRVCPNVVAHIHD